MAIDLGVVGVFKARRVEIPADTGGDQDNQDRSDDERVDAPRLLGFRSGLFGAQGWRLCLCFSAHWLLPLNNSGISLSASPMAWARAILARFCENRLLT